MAEILEAVGSLEPSQTVSLKSCSKCRETKSIGDFHRDARARDGAFAYCKACTREYLQTPNAVASRRAYQRDTYIRKTGRARPWQEMLAAIGAP